MGTSPKTTSSVESFYVDKNELDLKHIRVVTFVQQNHKRIDIVNVTAKAREMATNIRLPHICRRALLNREGDTKRGRVGTKNSTNLSNKDFIICKGRH